MSINPRRTRNAACAELARIVSCAPIVLALLACGEPPILAPATGPLAPPEEPAPAPVPMDRAKERTTLGLLGTEVGVPAGFHYAMRPNDTLRIEVPERDATVVLALVASDDATAALEHVWAQGELSKPGSRPAELRTPANETWDEVVQLDYPGDDVVALGNARRKGNTVFVTLLRGSPDAMKKYARELSILAREWELVDRHWAVRKPLPWSADNGTDLDAFATKALTDLHVPGLAYAVVEGGKVVHERVLGVKELGKPAKVRRETRFLLGALTEPLSTQLVSALADAGTLTWDTPVSTLLPSFRLQDATITAKLTLRHAFCACTDLPRQDLPLLFQHEGETAEQALATLFGLTAPGSLGTTFQYSNQLVGSGGYAAAHAAYPELPLEAAYERAMLTHVFGPLGMKQATTSFTKALAGDHAMPHASALDTPERPAVLPTKVERFVLPWAPAGAAWASLADLERYLQTELADGVAPGGTRVTSREQAVRRRARDVQIGPRAFFGLGLASSDRFGLVEVERSGGTFGMTAQLVFHPETGRGVVVLANAAEPLIGSLVARRALELAYGDAHAEPALLRALAARRTSATKTAESFLPADSTLAASLLGTFENPRLGQLRIVATPAPDLVRIDAGEWSSRVRLARTASGAGNDLVLLDPPAAGLAFTVRGAGPSATLAIELGQEHEEFARVP